MNSEIAIFAFVVCLLPSVSFGWGTSPSGELCQSQEAEFSRMQLNRLPLPANVEFAGQFVIEPGESCSNKISAGLPGHKQPMSCDVCLISPMPGSYSYRDGDSAKRMVLKGVKSIEKVYHDGGMQFTTSQGLMMLKCGVPLEINDQGYFEVTTLKDLCMALGNVKGTNSDAGVVLRTKKVEVVEATLRAGDFKRQVQ